MTTHRQACQRLAAVPGLGSAQASSLVRRGVTTRALLRRVMDELPKETQAHLRYRVSQKIPAKEAAAATAEIRRRLTLSGESGMERNNYTAITVGSVRRGAQVSKDLDLLIIIPAARDVRGVLAGASLRPPRTGDRATFVETYAEGPRRRSVIVRWRSGGGKKNFYALDLFLATAEEEPFALLHFTGGRDFNIRVRAHAKKLGMSLNQYGLFRESGGTRRRVRGSRGIRTERELLDFLGVSYLPPSRRAGPQQ